MHVLLKVAFAIAMVVLLVSALLVVMVGLLSASSSDPFPKLADPCDGEPDHDVPGALTDGR
jgi:hypothetical protein